MNFKLIPMLAIAITACQSNKGTLLNVSDFSERSAAPGAQIIDVRTPEEYSEGFIKGAVNIDYNGEDFESKIADLDKKGTYFLYCKSGGRSGQALEKMGSKGFKNIYGLEGGIKAWKTENKPLIISDTGKHSEEVKDPTDFKTAIFGDKLVFVDFNATWCGPCKKMQPFVDMLKEERSREVIVFSIDTDQETDIAREYQVMNLPTIVLIRKGVVLYRAEGFHDQEMINQLVNKFK